MMGGDDAQSRFTLPRPGLPAGGHLQTNLVSGPRDSDDPAQAEADA